MSEEQVFTQCTVGGPVRVYVEDGVIKRMRPIIFDEDDAPSWTIEARGRKFTPPRKTTLQSYEVPERTRVYTNRIQYPLKRKNFDPKRGTAIRSCAARTSTSASRGTRRWTWSPVEITRASARPTVRRPSPP